MSVSGSPDHGTAADPSEQEDTEDRNTTVLRTASLSKEYIKQVSELTQQWRPLLVGFLLL